MDKRVSRMWWENLKLGPTTAQLVAARGTRTPAALAGMARTVPDAFRKTFDEEAQAELARALGEHLKANADETEGYGDLLEALEELSGKRPAKPIPPPPAFGFGVAPSPTPVPPIKPGPPPPKLGPGRKTFPPSTHPKAGGDES